MLRILLWHQGIQVSCQAAWCSGTSIVSGTDMLHDAAQAPPSDTKEFKPAAREDEWGSTKTPARRNVPASQVKTDLQPYDSDDYGHNLGAPQDRVISTACCLICAW